MEDLLKEILDELKKINENLETISGNGNYTIQDIFNYTSNCEKYLKELTMKKK